MLYQSLGGGLCNRLKSLVAALRKAAVQQTEVTFFWNDSPWLWPYREEEVVGRAGIRVHYPWPVSDQAALTDWEQKRLRRPVQFTDLFSNELLWQPVTAPDDEKHSCAGWWEPHEHVDQAYQAAPQEARHDYVPWFQFLEPKLPSARQLKANLAATPDKLASVHIRNAFDWQISGWTVPLERYFELMDKLRDQGYTLQVVCHEQAIESLVRERYVNDPRVKFLIAKRWWGLGRFEDAVTELYRLANCHVLLASENSTFSEVGWWIGGCRAKVCVVTKDGNNLAELERCGL